MGLSNVIFDIFDIKGKFDKMLNYVGKTLTKGILK